MKPEISVIIPALNEEAYIRHPLAGLKRQSFKRFETIVVDSMSDDRTAEIARKRARIITDKRMGISSARNRGAKAAKGEILVFIDADTKPTAGLLKEYCRIFKDEETVAASGPILPLENTNIWVKIGYLIVSNFFVRATIALGMPSLVGSNFAVRKSAFKKVGGFNPKLRTYEDWDLSLRLSRLGKITYDKKAVVHTSARRVLEWGIFGYFRYHTGNMVRYNLFKKPKSNYDPIR